MLLLIEGNVRVLQELSWKGKTLYTQDGFLAGDSSPFHGGTEEASEQLSQLLTASCGACYQYKEA